MPIPKRINAKIVCDNCGKTDFEVVIRCMECRRVAGNVTLLLKHAARKKKMPGVA